jgi:hypothetical protein
VDGLRRAVTFASELTWINTNFREHAPEVVAGAARKCNFRHGEYLETGGRIFTTDYMYTWFRYTPSAALRSAVTLRGGAPAGGRPLQVDTSFPKGRALSEWLNDAAGVPGGIIMSGATFSNVASLDATKAVQWEFSGAPNPGPRVFSVYVPVGVAADQQCGKGVHVDVHVNSTDRVDENYPASCSSDLEPSENLLTFFFFDLASCIQNESEPPKPPPVK